MKLFLGTLLFVAIATGLELHSDETFSKLISDDNDAVFGLFVTPTCARCKTIEADLDSIRESIAQYLLSANVTKTLHIVKFDMHESPNVVADLQIEGTPTMVLLKTGHVHEYGGAVETDELGAWLQRRLGEPMRRITESEVEEFSKAHEVAIVAYVDEHARLLFESVIEALRDIPHYAWVDVDEKSPQYNMIYVHKHGSETPAELKFDLNDLPGTRAWLLEKQMPFIGEITLSNLQSYLQQPKSFIWFVGLRPDYEQVRTTFIDVIRSEQKKYWWVWMDPSASARNMEFVKSSLMPRHKPGFVLTDIEGPGRFTLNEPLSKLTNEGLRSWLREVESGESKRVLKSQAAPEVPIDAITGVETVVTDNFVSRLSQLRQTSDIVLIIDSLWCETCESMIKKIRELATSAGGRAESKCLNFVAINGRLNELDPSWKVHWDQLPAVWLLPVAKAGEEVNEPTRWEWIQYGPTEPVELVEEWIGKNGECAKKLKDKDEL